MAGALQGCTIVLSGQFPKTNHGALEKKIKENGGTFRNKITGETTHLVATTIDWEKGSTKVNAAREDPDIQIVTLAWLLDSISKTVKADEQSYLLEAESQHSQNGNVSKKRTRDGESKASPSDELDDRKPAMKKPQGKQAGTMQEDAEDEPPAKKQKGRAIADVNDEGESSPVKQRRDGQKAKSSNLTIPVDEGCPMQGTHRVYIDPDGIIFDVSLNQANAGANNNKFYRIQLLESPNGHYVTWTRWGRVGEHGQSKLLGNGAFGNAMTEFEKKFKDKTGHKWADRLEPPKKGKYTFIERSYEPDSSDDDDYDLPGAGSRRGSKASNGGAKSERKVPDSTLARPVQDLIKLIFNQQFFSSAMADMGYDANKLPLGKLSKRTLEQGYQALKDLSELLAQPQRDFQAVAELSNRYYTVIPHDFGRNRPIVINHDDLLKREVELLESLSDMSIAASIMKDAKTDSEEMVHPIDRQYAGLGMSEMTTLDHSSSEFSELENYLLKTHGQTHSMKMRVEEIFRIERSGENDRFAHSPYANINDDRRLLWHGSRTTNFGGILSQGLRIAPPEAPVSGYMFGKGVYLADISSKSANYCYASMSNDTGLLLLCEAELGKPMLELTDAHYDAGEEAKSKGCLSTWGKGLTTPKGWKDAGCVHSSLDGVIMPDTKDVPGPSGIPRAYLQYNEYICYDVAQIRLRYLFRVKMTPGYNY